MSKGGIADLVTESIGSEPTVTGLIHIQGEGRRLRSEFLWTASPQMWTGSAR